jgi:signal transduction histidine kinase
VATILIIDPGEDVRRLTQDLRAKGYQVAEMPRAASVRSTTAGARAIRPGPAQPLPSRFAGQTAQGADVQSAQWTRRLIQAQESERQHIARELHDVIGQAMAVTQVNLEVLKQAFPDKSAQLLIEDTLSMLEEALQQVRSLALDLRPRILDDVGLAAAVRGLVDRLTARTAIAVDYRPEPLEKLPAETQTACFRIVQEGVANAVRHAKAGHLCIELRTTDAMLRLVVRDDGAGFDVQGAMQRAMRGQSMGLIGMKERARLLGGRAEITSRPSQGTEVCAWLPLVGRETADE